MMQWRELCCDSLIVFEHDRQEHDFDKALNFGSELPNVARAH